MAKEKGLALVKYLSFYPEYREDGEKTAPLETGRFKHFRAVSKSKNSPILIANLLFMITLIPLIAIFVVINALGGIENIAYNMNGITDTPFIMSNVGFGMSNYTQTTLQIRLDMLKVYYLIFAAVGVGTFIMSIGLSGMVPLCMKFIIGDKCICKKDNYGNDVPRACKEFFIGLKRCIKEMLFVGGMFIVIFAGFGNIFVYFVSQYWMGTANAGHWVMVIITGIIALLCFMFLLHLIPSIALYDMPFKDKLKNSLILTFQFFLQNLVVVTVFSIPFVLATTLNTFISAAIFALLLVFGSKYYCLTMCNFEQYISEKLIQPVYEMRAKSRKGKKK